MTADHGKEKPAHSGAPIRLRAMALENDFRAPPRYYHGGAARAAAKAGAKKIDLGGTLGKSALWALGGLVVPSAGRRCPLQPSESALVAHRLGNREQICETISDNAQGHS